MAFCAEGIRLRVIAGGCRHRHRHILHSSTIAAFIHILVAAFIHRNCAKVRVKTFGWNRIRCEIKMDDHAIPSVVSVSRAGYNVPDVKWHGIDEETLLKVENDAEDVKGLFIEGFMIFDQVDEDGNFAEDDDDVVDIIIHPWADAERIGFRH